MVRGQIGASIKLGGAAFPGDKPSPLEGKAILATILSYVLL